MPSPCVPSAFGAFSLYAVGFACTFSSTMPSSGFSYYRQPWWTYVWRPISFRLFILLSILSLSVLIWKMDTGLVIFFFFVIFLKIHVLCISFGLVWAFKEKHLCYGAKKKVNREHGKKSFGESNDNTRCLIFRSKLVVFNNCWTCLVFPQTSREIYGIYPNQ